MSTHTTTNLGRMAWDAAERFAPQPGEPLDTKNVYFNGYMVGLSEGFAMFRDQYLVEKQSTEEVIASYQAKEILTINQASENAKRAAHDWRLRLAALVSVGARIDKIVAWLKSPEDKEEPLPPKEPLLGDGGEGMPGV